MSWGHALYSSALSGSIALGAILGLAFLLIILAALSLSVGKFVPAPAVARRRDRRGRPQ
jgi:hypothetical protein